MSVTALPLSRRPWDIVFIAFFAINFGFITYMIDIEQIVIFAPVVHRFLHRFHIEGEDN